MIIEIDNIILDIHNSALDNMKRHIQDESSMHESGGILVGYVLSETRFSITDVSIPNKSDRSGRYSFNRNKKAAQDFINNKHSESQNKKIYLGEWHTHPEDSPYPSRLDNMSIRKQFKDNVINSNVIFMVILGIKDLFITYVDSNGIGSNKKLNYTKSCRFS